MTIKNQTVLKAFNEASESCGWNAQSQVVVLLDLLDLAVCDDKPLEELLIADIRDTERQEHGQGFN
jgi:hypothetical protein